MITLHHLEKSRSFRIIWALEELELAYKIECYERSPSFFAPDALKKIHPLGKAPILVDGENVVVESGAILEYLQKKYDTKNQFKPRLEKDEQQYTFWLHYAEGSLMPLLVFHLVLNLSVTKVPFVVRPLIKKFTTNLQSSFIQTRLKDHIDYMESYLERHRYFAGDFSFADIQMCFPLEKLAERTQFKHPNIVTYLNAVQCRPAYQTALKKQ